MPNLRVSPSLRQKCDVRHRGILPLDFCEIGGLQDAPDSRIKVEILDS